MSTPAIPPKLLSYLPIRPPSANKYTFGSLLIIAGSCGKTGAAILAARAALKAGAGLVTIACPSSERGIIAGSMPDIMTYGATSQSGAFSAMAAGEILDFALHNKFSAALLGPGLSLNEDIILFVKKLLEKLELPLIIDADALNAISRLGSFPELRRPPAIISPHEGEAARLLGVRKINNRSFAAKALSSALKGVAVLKGPGTLVSDGTKILRSDAGGNELAKAGSGDVLSGIIASIYMQNGLMRGFNMKTAFGSALLAVYLHGICGALAKEKYTARSVLASELNAELPEAFKLLEKNEREFKRS